MKKLKIKASNVTYSILAKIYQKMGDIEKALNILEEMKSEGVKAGVFVYTFMIQTINVAFGRVSVPVLAPRTRSTLLLALLSTATPGSITADAGSILAWSVLMMDVLAVRSALPVVIEACPVWIFALARSVVFTDTSSRS